MKLLPTVSAIMKPKRSPQGLATAQVDQGQVKTWSRRLIVLDLHTPSDWLPKAGAKTECPAQSGFASYAASYWSLLSATRRNLERS
jgi:hypothetical protein